MRVRRALVNVQLAESGTTEAVVRDHALDGAVDDELRMATAATLGRLGLVATDVSGEAHVLLLDFLLAGKDGFFGVDHNHVIAGIDMIRIDSFVFSAKQYSGFFSHATHDLIVGVDNIPLAFNELGLGTKGFHREPTSKP